MRILREVTAVSLAFLSALLPVQEVLEKKAGIGFLNVKEHQCHDWRSFDRSDINSKAMELFKSEKGKEAFGIFLRTAKDDCGIEKIIKLPDPPANISLNRWKVRGGVIAA
jgi:hypothetical protein